MCIYVGVTIFLVFKNVEILYDISMTMSQLLFFFQFISSLYCIVSIHLYSASCSAHQSEALPVRETQREKSSC